MSVYRKGGIELRLGDYRDVLADVEPDAVITDPPYSQRTHAGALSATGERGVSGYGAWCAADVTAFVAWASSARGWIVAHTDPDLGPLFLDAFESVGRYRFPLVPVLQHMPRLTGDGHPTHGHYLAVCRPKRREFLSWGSLPGWYESGRDGSIVRGGKPLALMREIVRDHSRPGDLICDPCAGGATTLIAAALEGRRAIGAELDPATFEKACARIERTALTPPLPGLDVERRPAEQTGLGFEEESA